MYLVWRGALQRAGLVGAAAVVTIALVVPSALAAGSTAPPPPPTGSATPLLPALPKVPLTITEGQSPQALLSNAITLASVGLDTSALRAAIDLTQAKLEKDAITAQSMGRVAAEANARAATALQQAQVANAGFHSLDGALKNAVLFLYTDGPAMLTINPEAGNKLLYAMDYASTAITPDGILATRRGDASAEHKALAIAEKAQKTADRAAAKAAKALRDQQAQEERLRAELASISTATAGTVASDHSALAYQAGAELLSASPLQFTPKTPVPPPLSTTPVALTWAFSELGKPYVWAATGPKTFDCSGLSQFVWRQAGVSIPRVAADQDAWSVPVPLSQLLPGDLVFYGTTDIHHVGIYIGDGLMINAPHTGDVVRVSSIWWSDLAGFGRVHAPGTPVPLHQPPSVQAPAKPAVTPKAGPVPSQHKPPPGWKPKPGVTTPIRLDEPGSSSTTTTTTTLPPTTTTTTTTTVPSTTTTTVPVITLLPTTTTTTTVPSTTTAVPPGP
jgi:cell wall-associated NlpC family hydrolase